MEALQQSVRTGSFCLQTPSAATAATRARSGCTTPSLALGGGTPRVSSSLVNFDSSAMKLYASSGGSRRRRGGAARVVAMAKSAATGYAGALADVAQAQKKLEAVNEDVEKLGRYLEDKQLWAFLTNPTIIVEHKKAVLQELARDAKFHPTVANLLSLVVDKKRTAILKDLVKEFQELYNDLTDTQVAIVTSAVEIDKSQLSLIGKKLQSISGAKNVKLKNVIDPSLIAGFIVRFGKDGSRLIDMSVKGQLDRIAAQIDVSDKATAPSY